MEALGCPLLGGACLAPETRGAYRDVFEVDRDGARAVERDAVFGAPAPRGGLHIRRGRLQGKTGRGTQAWCRRFPPGHMDTRFDNASLPKVCSGLSTAKVDPRTLTESATPLRLARAFEGHQPRHLPVRPFPALSAVPGLPARVVGQLVRGSGGLGPHRRPRLARLRGIRLLALGGHHDLCSDDSLVLGASHRGVSGRPARAAAPAERRVHPPACPQSHPSNSGDHLNHRDMAHRAALFYQWRCSGRPDASHGSVDTQPGPEGAYPQRNRAKRCDDSWLPPRWGRCRYSANRRE